MKQTVLLIMLLVSSVLAAEDNFKSMVEQYIFVKRSFPVVDSMQRGTIRYNDFMKKIKAFADSCAEYQKTVEKHNIGNDLMFDRYASLLLLALKNTKQDKVRESDISKGSRFHIEEVPVSHVFKLFSSDVRMLREQGLAHPPVNKQLIPWLPFFEFERLYEYYRAVHNKFNELSGNIAWKRMFENRMRLMRQAAVETEKLLKIHKLKTASAADLVVECDVLLEYYISVRKKITMDGLNVKDSELRAALGKRSGKNANGENDMKLALRNIDELSGLVHEMLDKEIQEARRQEREEQAEAAKKQREEEKAKREAEKEAAKNKPEEPEKPAEAEKPAEIPVERLKEDALAERLEALREKTFPADTQKTLDDGQLEQCKRILSADQLTQFESIRARYIRSGQSESAADLEALRALRPLLKTKNYTPNKAETIRILKQAGIEK